MKMERAELSIYRCNAIEKAYQKYGPFICPSELRELTNCLPRLFEVSNLQIGDTGVRMKMPRLTGERHVSIVDLEINADGEITVFAIDNLSPGDNIRDILCILEQTTGRDVLRGRALRTISGEEVDEEYCLNDDDHTILTVGSALCNSPLQETPLPNVNVLSDAQFKLLSNGEPPPIEDTNAPTIEDESFNRGAQLMSYASLEDTEKIGDQLCKSPQVGQQNDLTTSETEGQDEDKPIRDIIHDCNSGSSSPLIMPEDFESLLAQYPSDDYKSDSMNELPEGREEATANHARRIEQLTAQEITDIIFNDKAGREKFKTAYYESFTFRERGGWIFVNPSDPTQIKVVLAPISASDSFHAADMTTPSIDLNDISTNGVPPDYVLVANFHTHPLFNNEKPSRADVENAYYRGMPGIVISRTKIFGYGPERRINVDEPHKYAPPMEENNGVEPRKLSNNPFPLM